MQRLLGGQKLDLLPDSPMSRRLVEGNPTARSAIVLNDGKSLFLIMIGKGKTVSYHGPRIHPGHQPTGNVLASVLSRRAEALAVRFDSRARWSTLPEPRRVIETGVSGVEFEYFPNLPEGFTGCDGNSFRVELCEADGHVLGVVARTGLSLESPAGLRSVNDLRTLATQAAGESLTLDSGKYQYVYWSPAQEGSRISNLQHDGTIPALFSFSTATKVGLLDARTGEVVALQRGLGVHEPSPAVKSARRLPLVELGGIGAVGLVGYILFGRRRAG